MKAPRTRYRAEFKAKYALELIRGERTLNEIAGEAKVHPNVLTGWKEQLLEGLPTLFADKRVKDHQEDSSQSYGLSKG